MIKVCVYYVSAHRNKGGGIGSPVKAVESKIFFHYEDARKFAIEKAEELNTKMDVVSGTICPLYIVTSHEPIE